MPYERSLNDYTVNKYNFNEEQLRFLDDIRNNLIKEINSKRNPILTREAVVDKINHYLKIKQG